MRVSYFGTWERGYPRNEQVIAALRTAGVAVDITHEPLWEQEHKFSVGAAMFPRLLLKEARLALRRLPAETDALVVGYPGYPDLVSAKRHRKPVIFNAMVSLHDTLVGDRRRFQEGSAAAAALKRIDRFALRSADTVVADTAANARFLAEYAGIELPQVAYVGAEERLFRDSWRPPEQFHALFVGKLIPLHGLEVILEAAARLPDIPFRIIGTGQLENLLRNRPPNVEHVPWVEYADLPQEYARAGCALGVFGSSAKAQRVIPNKAFQALAIGVPLVTADTPAARELLQHGRDAVLIPRSGESLADAIRSLHDDRGLAIRIGRAGRETFEREASEQALGERWREIVAGTVDERH